MLQIVTKMYFREGVPLHSTVHRAVLHTNLWFLRPDVVELPVGELAPSTESAPVNSLTVSIVEHLETTLPDGSGSPVISVGQRALPESLADVLAFALDAVVSLDGDLVRRLVPNTFAPSEQWQQSRLFRRTFEPHRLLREEELGELRRFMNQLLALERSHFESVMRAIRRIVRATHRAVDDPTLAYVDLVTALEALGTGTSGAKPSWERLDGRKRKLIDEALAAVDAEAADRVRDAVLEAEHAGAKNRFVSFVLEHVSPAFFREEAAGVIGPIRGAYFERALKIAYDVRSRNVHVLEDLPVEAWAINGGAETAAPPGMGTILSVEGLARLARHVVHAYVDRAPTDLDQSFNWRARLPGQIRVQFAPQYWIWQGEHLDHESAGRYFSGAISNLLDVWARRSEPVDMNRTLERIEGLLPATADSPAKELMVALYAIWHDASAEELRRPDSAAVIEANRELLQRPSVPAFVASLIPKLEVPVWDVEDWKRLAEERRAQRSRRTALTLPSGLDAALQVTAAEQLLEAGRVDEAVRIAAYAVEERPGDQQLVAWEAGLARRAPPPIDLHALLDLPPQETDNDGT